MAYCTNCGNYVEDGAKFCGKCGKKMSSSSAPNISSDSAETKASSRITKRETVYEGEIHKCPNCGATLSSFVKSCPECGYELRGAASANSVQEFSKSYASATNNSKKIDLIRTFVIPNTREDILEFAILASSNIDAGSYTRGATVVSGGVSQQEVSEAWMAKFEQAQQKANILLTDDPYLEKINKLYSDKKKELSNAKTMSVGKKVIGGIFGNDFIKIMAPFILLMVLMGVGFPLLLGGGEKKLEKQVKQIEAYIAEENYDAALTTAYAMSDSYSNSWSETRASLINRIQNLQAKKEGLSEANAGKVQFPAQTLTGKQVSDVVSILTAAGFTNVTQEPVQTDLLTGWLDKMIETKGEVEEITVNGSTDYTSGAWLPPDTPIIVRYWK
ncbi:zinc ribbon domain-containing protein [Butyrivibrio sp. AE3004]|uniref:zinc ribbon domain-containing protein n=1 Tax=Butyrivibrio sp. AE3004 TaxID=1506994 RepID=UPI00068C7ACF|nr:zinc ribbon domain-containing protein [Butyrivibrio sp. AE3004]